MSEDAPQMATSEEGQQVPVRYEGDSFTQTDTEGKSLLTGEDLSPGSPLVDENYEHNPDKAREMASAGDGDRTTAKRLYEEGAKLQGGNDMGNPEAEYYSDEAEEAERKAGEHYDEEKGLIDKAQPEVDEALQQPGTASGNLSREQNVELTSQITQRAVMLQRKAAELAEYIAKSNSVDDYLSIDGGGLRHVVKSEHGQDGFQFIASSDRFLIQKRLESSDGLVLKEIVVQRKAGEDIMVATLYRYGPNGKSKGEIKLSDSVAAATADLVIGTLEAKVAEREQNSTENINAEVAEILGTEYTPPAPTLEN